MGFTVEREGGFRQTDVSENDGRYERETSRCLFER
jgi:hypothetical protein